MTYLLEHWKPVVGYEDHYEISNCGNVRKRNGRHLALTPSEGYRAVTLRRNKDERLCKVHRLALAAFVGECPSGRVVNHIDGRKDNNRVSNLEYVTQAENFRHAVRLGLNSVGMKLSDDDVRQVLIRVQTESPKKLADEYGVSRGLISGIKHGHQQIRRTSHLLRNPEGNRRL